MPRLSDVLKNKNHGETPWERQQRLEIEDQIAAEAILQEEAALEAELQNEVIDAGIALHANESMIEPPNIVRNTLKNDTQINVNSKHLKL